MLNSNAHFYSPESAVKSAAIFCHCFDQLGPVIAPRRSDLDLRDAECSQAICSRH